MEDDIRVLLERAAATPRHRLRMDELHLKARRSRLARAAGLVVGIGVIGLTAVTLALALPDRGGPLPASSPSSSPTPSESAEEESVEEEPKVEELDWPDPFVPPTSPSGNRTLLPVLFPDRTRATLSYPSDLHLSARGIQPTISYTFDNPRPNSPHEIIFIHGNAPPGLLDPEPLESFNTTPYASELRRLTASHLRGNPPYAVVYKTERWTILATVQQREDAATVANDLHVSVTRDDWPTVLSSGSLHLQEGFGEARGAHLEIGDANPLFDIRSTAGQQFAYIITGPVTSCHENDNVSKVGGDWYGAKCLSSGPDERGIFLSIYGPEQYVRDVHEGIRLET